MANSPADGPGVATGAGVTGVAIGAGTAAVATGPGAVAVATGGGAAAVATGGAVPIAPSPAVVPPGGFMTTLMLDKPVATFLNASSIDFTWVSSRSAWARFSRFVSDKTVYRDLISLVMVLTESLRVGC